MAWTTERKQQVIDMYKEANPTPENSMEICKQIAEELEESANGVRMVLVQAGAYVKKDPNATAAAKPTAAKASSSGEGTKRVSKEDSLAALREAIEARGAEVDEEIVGKLTGKAAVYFTKVLKA